MERPRVLVVEDRPSVLKLMATVLESVYDVLTASDGTTALSLIGATHIDVVLTDIRMPGMSGFEILRAVLERSPRTAVVMMTAFANVPDAVSAMKMGAFDYFAKPLDADEIALVVARAVEHVREPERGDGGAPRARRTDLPDLTVGYRRAVDEARDRASREYLTNLMRLFGGNVTRAAQRAGITRESLHRVLRKYAPHAAHGDGHAARADGEPADDGAAGALS
ncbi:MAG TPA: response regulator [Anaeromyxobacter sp.]|nr:response regulator [Anaeromyxobacter sp.]